MTLNSSTMISPHGEKKLHFWEVQFQTLRICSGAFRTSPVESLYINYMEPSLTLTWDELSPWLYYRILSHPLHTHLLSTENDTLYRNKPSFIPSFGLRLRNIIQGTPLSSINAHSQTYFIPYPWNFKRIASIFYHKSTPILR